MRILVIILLLVSGAAKSQMACFTSQMSDFTLMGGLEHLAPANPYGHKEGWIIYLHGIDHRRIHPASIGDTSRITVIKAKGVPKLVANAPLPLFQKPGGGATDLYRWNVIAPQADSDDGQWKAEAITLCIQRIKALYGSTTDTNKIILIGYSLGGGGVFSCLRFSSILPNLSYAVSVAGGYINTADYVTLAKSGIPADVFSTIGDQLAPPAGRSDTWVTGINAQVPVKVVNHIRLTDVSPTNSPTDHDKILQIIIEDTTANDSYLMTNGDTWTRNETLFHRGLRYEKQRPSR